MDLRQFYPDPNEGPLDSLKPDGGLFGIFRTVAVVGDSLASGELESQTEDGVKGWHDVPEYTWGQYMARAAGLTVRDFCRGGMTAREYVESWGEECDFWDPKKAAQAYILALGANDLFNKGEPPIGSLEDVVPDCPEQNGKTFAGYYAAVIQRYKRIQPKARFFLMTMPRSGDARADGIGARHAALLHEFARLFDYTYVVDLFRDAPPFDAAFRDRFFLGGHMSPAGYLVVSRIVMSYVDWIIRNNPDDFAQVGFIGTPWHNVRKKW